MTNVTYIYSTVYSLPLYIIIRHHHQSTDTTIVLVHHNHWLLPLLNTIRHYYTYYIAHNLTGYEPGALPTNYLYYITPKY